MGKNSARSPSTLSKSLMGKASPIWRVPYLALPEVYASLGRAKEWQDVFGKSKYKDQKDFGSWEGPILLQDHSDPVWFKELHISRL